MYVRMFDELKHGAADNPTFGIQYFIRKTKLAYDELLQKCKDKISKIINKNNYSINTSTLKV